jgi:hypothetical protein
MHVAGLFEYVGFISVRVNGDVRQPAPLADRYVETTHEFLVLNIGYQHTTIVRGQHVKGFPIGGDIQSPTCRATGYTLTCYNLTNHFLGRGVNHAYRGRLPRPTGDVVSITVTLSFFQYLDKLYFQCLQGIIYRTVGTITLPDHTAFIQQSY